jgi:hypothetical protein
MEIVEKYQCSGCVCGCDTSCYEKTDYGVGCEKHVVGTTISGLGRIFLGMPVGFCRLGTLDSKMFPLGIFENLKDGYLDKFNIPVWKYYDGTVTMMRGLSPRINLPFINIFIGNHLDEIDCLEITDEDIKEMD